MGIDDINDAILFSSDKTDNATTDLKRFLDIYQRKFLISTIRNKMRAKQKVPRITREIDCVLNSPQESSKLKTRQVMDDG